MYWVEAIAWKNIDVLDEEFDQWEYGQHIEQRYASRAGTFNNHIPTGYEQPSKYEPKKKEKCARYLNALIRGYR